MGIQALAPNGRALKWIKWVKPRGAKFVIVHDEDYADWMLQIPKETFVVARWYGDGSPDYLPWTPENAVMLADIHERVHNANHRRPDVFECTNEPIIYHPDAMKRYAEFQRIWALRMRDKGIKTIVGNFSVGNPQVMSADGINLMQHFRPAMEVGDFFGYHGYSCPEATSHPRWQCMRYNELFVDAGMSMPVILTECGVDCGSTGHGYKERWSDEQFVPQLMTLDQMLRADKKCFLATVFCMGTYGSWKTFDLTDNAGWMLGEYIINQGDVEENMGADIKVMMSDGYTIRTMDLEEYKRGVVPREAIASWGDLPNGMEVLKAQAVATGTYAAFAIFHPRHGAAAVCTTQHCQVWTPATDHRTDQAIRETAGAFVTKDGDIIQTQYISRCGRPVCPLCQGRDGYDGKTWYGRMCQWGAKFMAVNQGKTWRQILQLYYPDADWGPAPEPEPEPEPEWESVKIKGTVTVRIAGQDLRLPVSSVDLQVIRC